MEPGVTAKTVIVTGGSGVSARVGCINAKID